MMYACYRCNAVIRETSIIRTKEGGFYCTSCFHLFSLPRVLPDPPSTTEVF